MGRNLHKVSVIIPVYNAGCYLKLCLESVINQTYKELEIIIIDDGSTDLSWEIITEYAKRDNRIRAFTQENQGQSAARNFGIKIATGEFIMFIDSDDYIVSDMIEILYGNLIQYKADVSVCAIKRCTEKNFNSVNLKKSEKVEVSDSLQCAIYAMDWKHFYSLSPCNKIFKAELFQNIWFTVGRIYEDIYFNFEILSQAKRIVLTSSEKYVQIVKNQNSTTAAPFNIKHLDRLTMVNKACEVMSRCFPEIQENINYFRMFNYVQVINKIYESSDRFCKEEEIVQDIKKMWIYIDKSKISFYKKLQVELLIHFSYFYRILYKIKVTIKKINL